MNTNTRYMAETMDLAHDLQDRYNHLKAAGTQNVRNPLPLRLLVLTVIPTLPRPTAIVDTQVRTKMTIAGRDFIKTFERKDFANNVLPPDYWTKKAVSAHEVYAILKKRGFIVSKGSISQFVSKVPGIQSIRVKRQVPVGHDARGTSYKRYFVESK
jgi:hypothetical protein